MREEDVDPLLRGRAERSSRLAAVFSSPGPVDLAALVGARDSRPAARPGGVVVNTRFLLNSVTAAQQTNRREQVSALWAAHEDSTEEGRAAAALKRSERQARLDAARAEEEELDRQEAQARAAAPQPRLSPVKRGRGEERASAEAGEESEESSEERRGRRKERKRRRREEREEKHRRKREKER
jgi:hypothetical protein